MCQVGSWLVLVLVQSLAEMLDTTVAASLVGMRALAMQQAVQTEQLAARNAAMKVSHRARAPFQD